MIQKLTMLFSVLLFMSCSNDSSDSNTTTTTPLTGILPKKITETTYYGQMSVVSTGEFNYENGVLKSIDSGNSRVEYVYRGDKIVKANYYDGNTLSGSSTIGYTGDYIFEMTSGDNNEKKQFQHQDGVLISKKEFKKHSGTWIASNEVVYSVNAFNITTEAITDLLYNPNNRTGRREFVLDSGKSPFKNLNPYFRYLFEFETFNPLNANNIVSQMDYETMTSTEPMTSRVFQIDYNSSGYPIEIKKIEPLTGTVMSKVEIEYISL